MTDGLMPEFCDCGHVVKWYEPFGPGETKPDWYFPDRKLVMDVVERDCPHENGTIIEHCPKCDAMVGIWGFGAVGSMECECWDD